MTDKACRRCAIVKPLTEFYGDFKPVKCNKTGKIIRKMVYKHHCKSCEAHARKERGKYTKHNKPKKSSHEDMAWAFSDTLEGVFYNRKRVH